MGRPAREWKTVKGWSRYEVSNYGEVRNAETGRLMKPNCASGYYTVCFSKPGDKKYFAVHRLVLEHFVSKAPKHSECNHKDGNKLNNRLSNLEWVTHQFNVIDSRKRAGFPVGVTKTSADVKEAIRILHGNMTVDRIAKLFSVNVHYVHSIVQKGSV